MILFISKGSFGEHYAQMYFLYPLYFEVSFFCGHAIPLLSYLIQLSGFRWLFKLPFSDQKLKTLSPPPKRASIFVSLPQLLLSPYDTGLKTVQCFHTPWLRLVRTGTAPLWPGPHIGLSVWSSAPLCPLFGRPWKINSALSHDSSSVLVSHLCLAASLYPLYKYFPPQTLRKVFSWDICFTWTFHCLWRGTRGRTTLTNSRWRRIASQTVQYICLQSEKERARGGETGGLF